MGESTGRRRLNIDDMVDSYIATALWSTSCRGAVDHPGCRGEDCDSSLERLGYSADDVSRDLFYAVDEDCSNYVELLESEDVYYGMISSKQMGHDLWLTRNEHGTGFWDRGHMELGNVLTKWAHSMGTDDWTVNGDQVERM